MSKDTVAPPPAEKLNARHVALALLNDVLGRRKNLDQALEDHDDFRLLPARDRAFVRMIASTTLRRLGQIDDIILKASERRDPPHPPVLHNLLRLGVAQLVFMAAADYAVVDTAVRLAEESGMGRQKGFVNALLRRVSREGQGWLAQQDMASLNIPAWLSDIWVNDYGPALTSEVALACLAEAPLDITIKDQGMHDYWAGELGAQILPTGTLRRMEGGAVHELPGFADGMWWIQDAAAALPVRLFGDVAGQRVLDLCAAPGGKTAQLAAAGAKVTALDRSVQRLQRLEENLRRLRLGDAVEIVAADAASWLPKEKASFVLLDAPCSATGTIRRNPDLLRLKSGNDMQRLMDLQARLLDNAALMTAPGGILIYCTCSLQKAEGEHQVAAFLARNKNFSRASIGPEETGGLAGLINEQGDLRILPSHLAAHGGMDGFFIARLRAA